MARSIFVAFCLVAFLFVQVAAQSPEGSPVSPPIPEAPEGAPIMAPEGSPVVAPVMSPTPEMAPVMTPTVAPVPAPARTPVRAPARSPSSPTPIASGPGPVGPPTSAASFTAPSAVFAVLSVAFFFLY